MNASVQIEIPGALYQALQLDDDGVRRHCGVSIIGSRRAGFGTVYTVALANPAKFRKDCEWVAYTNDTYGSSWKRAARTAIERIDCAVGSNG